MNSQRPIYQAHFSRVNKQRGIVLYIAIIALVVLMLAAVALIRSVNTTTVIAGNLAMKQSATISGDRGLWNGSSVITGMETAGTAAGQDPMTSAAHPYNINSPATGYYSTVGQINLTDSTIWSTLPSVSDASGNSIQYIVERLCRLGTVIQSTQDCLFNIQPNGDPKIRPGTNIGLSKSSNSPVFRITARVSGAKNTVSYVQSLYY